MVATYRKTMKLRNLRIILPQFYGQIR